MTRPSIAVPACISSDLMAWQLPATTLSMRCKKPLARISVNSAVGMNKRVRPLLLLRLSSTRHPGTSIFHSSSAIHQRLVRTPSHRFIYLWLCRYWSMGSITTLAKARKSVLWSLLKLLRRSVSMGCPNNRCSLCCEVSLHLFAWSSSNHVTI